ncbi:MULTISPECIES: hypothetical protein [Acidovorax]|uniref:Uncharacterized protein n=1 Tax=Acidovorax facilis TaxID=12917 RepID=A0ABV8DGV2_9BURK|nr:MULTISPECIES: hypothetical protein [Acidovorax]MBO1011716.1 hypothetical protein [Acidovorax sp. SD340]MCO4245684.1 hypothetical protein [Acidovorax facilis]
MTEPKTPKLSRDVLLGLRTTEITHQVGEVLHNITSFLPRLHRPKRYWMRTASSRRLSDF